MKKLLILTAIAGLLSSLNVQARLDFYIKNNSTKGIWTFAEAGMGCSKYITSPTAGSTFPDGTPSDFKNTPPGDPENYEFSNFPLGCSSDALIKSSYTGALTGVQQAPRRVIVRAAWYEGKSYYIIDVVSAGAFDSSSPYVNESTPLIFPGEWIPFPVTTEGVQTTTREEVVSHALSKSPKDFRMAVDFYLRPTKMLEGKSYIFMSDFQGPLKDGTPTNLPDLSSITDYQSFIDALAGYTWGDIPYGDSHNITRKFKKNISDYALDPVQ